MVRLLMALGALMTALAMWVGPAVAGDVTFYIQSQHPNVVSLEFYSQDRNYVWPGNSQVYLLEDYDTHEFALSCNKGEKICFGAWVRNRSDLYWGVGPNNAEYCTDCCYTCNGGYTQTIVLNP
ncbi:MAG: hypothetical protein H6873_04955 [Hyphomicrobiaceae bacterium]|nr:hypothetical protein [Hyphomicrobiaceae bacterium]